MLGQTAGVEPFQHFIEACDPIVEPAYRGALIPANFLDMGAGFADSPFWFIRGRQSVACNIRPRRHRHIRVQFNKKRLQIILECRHRRKQIPLRHAVGVDLFDASNTAYDLTEGIGDRKKRVVILIGWGCIGVKMDKTAVEIRDGFIELPNEVNLVEASFLGELVIFVWHRLTLYV